MRHTLHLQRSVLGMIAGLTALATLALATPAAHANQSLVRSAQSWSYQLTGNLGTIVASNADVVVVDADYGGNASRFKTKPGGGRRAAIAYLSVGEAEKWRGYWKGCCGGSQPSWLTYKTQGWAGNYAVKFWEPGWKAIVAQRVREIFAKGYDGLYLDRIDTWERLGSKAQMIQLIREIAAQARSIKGDAAIMVQNGEELLDNASYVSSIDAIAKEDLFHGINHDGRRNTSGDISASVQLLNRAKSQGKKIFVVEYLSGSSAASVAAEIRRQGYVPNFAGRNLGG
jgi:cysteinyl-tRNA synthetase, unknown class